MPNEPGTQHCELTRAEPENVGTACSVAGDIERWSERDFALREAAGLHRRDGFRVEAAAGVVGFEPAVTLRLGGQLAMLYRVPREALSYSTHRTVRDTQIELTKQLLGSITDCLNNGLDPYPLLSSLCDALRTGDLLRGFALNGAELIDIRVDEDDESVYQRHYRLADGRVLIWSENVYIEILTPAQYEAMQAEERKDASSR